MADAEAALAEMMVNGRGGPRDSFTAIALFQKAAREGHVGAMFALGVLYSGGHDIPANRSVAQHWFQAAAERGNSCAQVILSRYYPERGGGDNISVGSRPEL
jgi:TPR repeat protein